MRGAFIVIDGLDGSGKGTQIALLKKKLAKKRALFTHEPGGTKFAQEIRKVLLARRDSSTPLSDFFLFWAARIAHLEEIIKPALAAGKHVISDRFDSSTYAYQIGAEQKPRLEKLFRDCRKEVLGSTVPDAYIILDMPARVAIARRRSDHSKSHTAFDKKPIDYHARVRQGYKKFKPSGSKIYYVNADRTPEEVHEAIWSVVSRFVK